MATEQLEEAAGAEWWHLTDEEMELLTQAAFMTGNERVDAIRSTVEAILFVRGDLASSSDKP